MNRFDQVPPTVVIVVSIGAIVFISIVIAMSQKARWDKRTHPAAIVMLALFFTAIVIVALLIGIYFTRPDPMFRSGSLLRDTGSGHLSSSYWRKIHE